MSPRSNSTRSVEMSEWLKDRFHASRALQYSYASWIDLKSRAALFQGDSLEAASRLLKLWKQLGSERFGDERKSRLLELIEAACYRDGELRPIAENQWHDQFIHSPEANEIRKRYAPLTNEDRVRLRFPNDEDPERQGDLMIVKPFDPTTGERGVLMIKYSESILALPALFDLGQLASQYMLVLEPSYWGYQDLRFFLYLGSDLDVLVQSPRLADYEFIDSLKTNLVPIRVGAGEWGDPAVFRPREPNTQATYDVVMVAAWDPFKRHEVFFRAAAQLRKRGRRLRFALVGYELGWTREQVERLLSHFDLRNECTIFEDVPHAEVARVVAKSRVSLLVSQREGANKAIYESMFCGTPIVVYREQCGINLDHVNNRTGVLASDDELAEAIVHVLDCPDEFDPRGWAMENVGHAHATRKINAALAEIAARRNFHWKRDIVAKKNAPNLRYAEPGRYRDFAAEYERLGNFLRPLTNRTMRNVRDIPSNINRDKHPLHDAAVGEALFTELETNGIVVLPSLISPDQLRSMQAVFASRLGRMRWNNFDGYQQTEPYRQMIEDVLLLDEGFVDVALHPLVKEILTRYLGTNYELAEAKGWQTLPTKRDFHGWHGDAWYDQSSAKEIHREIKLGLYLTDVRSGAFNYIKGSHRRQHPRPVKKTEISQAQLNQIVEMTGVAGTAFLFDTSGIHRQAVPVLEPRQAIFLNYHDPNVRLQAEDVRYYRYHPLLLNAAFLGNLSAEDQRILGFGNKTNYQPAFERVGKLPAYSRAFASSYSAMLHLRRWQTKLARLLNR